MTYWKFWDYVSPTGINKIRQWYDGLPPEAQADFDVLLEDLAVVTKWQRPILRYLSGKKYKGVPELRFKAGRVQHRVLGYFQRERDFTLLIGCTHKGQVYSPPDARETAVRRKKLIETGKGSVCRHE